MSHLFLSQCFDHKISQPVAVKIIRNKKRFHHQALVEVKILDSLRKKVKSVTFSRNLTPLTLIFSSTGPRKSVQHYSYDRLLLLQKSPLYNL